MQKIRFGHKNSPLKIGSHLLTCYVLEDHKKVLTINSIQKALGYEGKSENWVVEFINKLNTFIPIDTYLSSAFDNTIIIKIWDKKKSFENAIEYPYFIDLCKIIMTAKEGGYLNLAELKYAKTAHQLLNTVEHSNIEELIDTTTGFKRFKTITLESLVAILKKQENDPAYEWIKTIPVQFTENILEMNQLLWEDISKNPHVLWELLNDLLFSRIDTDLWDSLRTIKPKRIYTRKDNKKQNIEHPKLKEYILIINSLIKASGNNWNIFIQLLNKTYPKQKNSSKIVLIEEIENKVIYPDFNEKLKAVLFK